MRPLESIEKDLDTEKGLEIVQMDWGKGGEMGEEKAIVLWLHAIPPLSSISFINIYPIALPVAMGAFNTPL